MARRRDSADDLRDAFLAVALIPVAGLHTASYWFKETLERTSKLATGVVATTTLARSAAPDGRRPRSAAVVDVLARDLFDSARAYVRGMVSLPADSAIYFTGELERRLDALLAQIQPSLNGNLDRYVEGELKRVLNELDRLALVVRSEVGRPSFPSRRAGARALRAPRRAGAHPLVRKIESLRTQTSAIRGRLQPGRAEAVSLARGDARALRALDLRKARAKFRDALEQAEALLGKRDRASLKKVRSLMNDLDGLATRALVSKGLPTG
jgi:hypothetical protein